MSAYCTEYFYVFCMHLASLLVQLLIFLGLLWAFCALLNRYVGFGTKEKNTSESELNKGEQSTSDESMVMLRPCKSHGLINQSAQYNTSQHSPSTAMQKEVRVCLCLCRSQEKRNFSNMELCKYQVVILLANSSPELCK